MMPNPTPITIQEIINLARKIREVFGSYNISSVDFQNFLQPERIRKMLIVVDFESAEEARAGNTYRVIMENNWSEVFIRFFSSTETLVSFLEEKSGLAREVEKHYYIQRNSLNYEKIIERTKKVVMQILVQGKK